MENIIIGSETELGVTTKSDDWRGLRDRNRIREFLGHLKNYLSGRTDFGDDLEEVKRTANWWEEDFDEEEDLPDEDSSEDQTIRRLGITGNRTPNGARLYIDGSHPECSTPECRSPREVVAHERAGVEMMRKIVDKVEDDLDVSIDLLKRNWNPSSNVSYACHENYMLSRRLFDRLVLSGLELSVEQAVWITHMTTRQIFTGSGRLNPSSYELELTLSQRQPFLETIFGISTTHDRSLINQRDRPYGDPRKYGRLHVITGDSNRADISNYLKYGTSALVLMMLEDWEEVSGLNLDDGYFFPVYPVVSFNRIRDKDSEVATRSGTISAIKAQRMIFDCILDWLDWRNSVGRPVRWANAVMRQWVRVLDLIRDEDEERLSRMLDYYIKKKIYRERWNRGSRFRRLESLDYNYHLVGESSLFHALKNNRMVETLVGFGEVEIAKTTPPKTRAALRSALLQEFNGDIAWSSWHTVEIYHEGRKRTIRMPSPASSTELQADSSVTDKISDVVDSVNGGE